MSVGSPSKRRTVRNSGLQHGFFPHGGLASSSSRMSTMDEMHHTSSPWIAQTSMTVREHGSIAVWGRDEGNDRGSHELGRYGAGIHKERYVSS